MISRLRPLLYLLLLALVGGSLSVLSKLALREIPGFEFIFLRFAVSAVILTLTCLVLRKRISWKKVKIFLPVAAIWWMASLFFAFGLQKTNATTAQFIHAFIPVAVAVLAAKTLHQTFSKHQWLGVAVAVVGVLTVILSSGDLSLTSLSLTGNLLVLLSAFGFAMYAVYSKLPKYESLDALEMIIVGIISGLVVSLPLAVWEYTQHHWTAGVSSQALVATVLAGLAITLFFGGSQLLIKRLGSSYMALNQYLIPLFVIVWAFIVLGERPEALAMGGAVVALTGVWLVTSRPAKASS